MVVYTCTYLLVMGNMVIEALMPKTIDNGYLQIHSCYGNYMSMKKVVVIL